MGKVWEAKVRTARWNKHARVEMKNEQAYWMNMTLFCVTSKVHYEDINENIWMKQKTTTCSILKIQNLLFWGPKPCYTGSNNFHCRVQWSVPQGGPVDVRKLRGIWPRKDSQTSTISQKIANGKQRFSLGLRSMYWLFRNNLTFFHFLMSDIDFEIWRYFFLFRATGSWLEVTNLKWWSTGLKNPQNFHPGNSGKPLAKCSQRDVDLICGFFWRSGWIEMSRPSKMGDFES